MAPRKSSSSSTGRNGDKQISSHCSKHRINKLNNRITAIRDYGNAMAELEKAKAEVEAAKLRLEVAELELQTVDSNAKDEREYKHQSEQAMKQEVNQEDEDDGSREHWEDDYIEEV
ncbi:hypothetical protein ACJQWK_00174 [Exserohilum turcicum]